MKKILTSTFLSFVSLAVLFSCLSPVKAISSWELFATGASVGDSNNIAFHSSIIYDGNLYVGTNNNVTGGEMWEYDGSGWTQFNTDGFGDASNVLIHALELYNGNMYASTENNGAGEAGEVWEYNGSSWSQINTDGFGDLDNIQINALQTYDSDLYAGTRNTSGGAQLWRYNGSTWSQITITGYVAGTDEGITCMDSYNGSLYIGISSYGSDTPEVWSYNGSGWTSITTDGFGDSQNRRISGMAAYDGDLYVGTFKNQGNTGTEVWQYNPSTSLAQINSDGFGDWDNTSSVSFTVLNNRLLVGTQRMEFGDPNGAEVWEYDGSSWTEVATDGFGDSDNKHLYSFAIYDQYIYATARGSALGIGGQIWRARYTGDLEVQLSSDKSEIYSGQQINYTIDVSNAGADPAATVTLQISLANGVSLDSISGSGWSCSKSKKTATCTRNELDAGQDSSLSMLVTHISGDPVEATATVSSAEFYDTNSGNNSDFLSIGVLDALAGTGQPMIYVSVTIGLALSYLIWRKYQFVINTRRC